MQRSSHSIGSLAAALAKAQAELINPEKSLVATIALDGPARGPNRASAMRRYRAGSTSCARPWGSMRSRRCRLPRSTRTAGIVNLTTVLAHASGEWIPSDWPVCAISETATPHRMGAALTYARRYALFTLVGIAGEDDLDAPDLTTPTDRTPGPATPKAHGNGQSKGTQHRSVWQGRRDAADHRQATPNLATEASAQFRDRLLTEVHELGSSDDAATWAHGNLADKNKLNAADAQAVENAFKAKLEALGVAGLTRSEAGERASATATLPHLAQGKPKNRRRSEVD